MAPGGSTRSAADALQELPASIRSMISPEDRAPRRRDRKLLLAASVQGHEFDSAVRERSPGGMDPADVEERLDVLEHIHVFVKRVKEHEFPDMTLSLQYQFVHVLYQNALYASLQPTRRASLSGRVSRDRSIAHPTGASTRGLRGGWGHCSRPPVISAASAQYFLEGARHAVGSVRVPRSAVAGRARPGSAPRDARRPRAQATRARAPDDPRAGPADDEGLGDTRDRAGIRAGARALPGARAILHGAVPGAVGHRALPRDQGRSAPRTGAVPTI
jgi:hypothetical protein